MPPRQGGISSAIITLGAVAVIIVAAIGVIVASNHANTTSEGSQTMITQRVGYNASGICLKEVPQNAVFSSYSNSTSQGYTVTYSNGTKDFFPVNSCPVPVTPANYQVDSIIAANPRFIVAENGATYEATNACNCFLPARSTNSTGQYAILNLVLYGNEKIYPCGASGYWTFNRLGLILVTIPMDSSGALQYSHAEIQAGGGFNMFSCTTTQST